MKQLTGLPTVKPMVPGLTSHHTLQMLHSPMLGQPGHWSKPPSSKPSPATEAA